MYLVRINSTYGKELVKINKRLFDKEDQVLEYIEDIIYSNKGFDFKISIKIQNEDEI